MNTWKIVVALTLAVLGVALVTASAYAYMGGRITPFATNTGTTAPYGNYGGMMDGGMMGGNSYGYGYNYGTPANVYNQITQPQPNTVTSTFPYYGDGIGCGSMRARTGYTAPRTITIPTNATPSEAPINITTAVGISQNYLTIVNNPNLAITQVEEYTNNFYIQVSEKSTGFGAFELLINKYTGAISPEMGPNMMWNTKYSMMNSGMMGLYVTTPTTAMPVNVTQAATIAQQYLHTALVGITVGDITTFYGHYTIELLSAGAPYGMLSVNGYTGQVWYHNWHGSFIQEQNP